MIAPFGWRLGSGGFEMNSRCGCEAVLRGSRATLHDHSNAMFRAQRDGGKKLHGMARDSFKMIISLDHGQQQHAFHHRERSADTYSWAAPEGKVGKPGNLAGTNRVISPAFRIESFGVREETRIALRQPLQNKDIRARRHAVAPELTFLPCPSAYPPHCRVKTQGFF